MSLHNQPFLFLLLFLSSSFCSAQSKGAVISHSTHIKVQPNRIVKEQSFLIQVDNKDAQWLGDIMIPQYGKSKVDIVEAHIQDIYGNNIRKLKSKEISEESYISSMALFEDDKVKKFQLVHDKFPYRIFYKYTVTNHNYISIANWIPITNTKVETKKATLIVDIPSKLEVKLDFNDLFEYHSEAIKDGSVKHIWTINNIKAIEENSFAPPIIESIPKVRVTSSTFKYGVKGSADTWADFGKWKSDLMEGLDDLPDEEKLKAKKLTKGISNKKEIIEILYKYLQDNHRYIYVGVDIGGLQPYPASYVTQNRYGDCKALTNYMKSLLKEVGIFSYYTTIYSGENPVKVDPTTPGHQSNHVILCVPLEKDTVWLENTSNWTPANYLGTFTQGRLALLIDGANSALVKTPYLSKENATTKRKFLINLENPESITCNMSAKLGGVAFDDINYLKFNSSKERQSSYIRNELIPFVSFEIDRWELIDSKSESVCAGFTADLTLKRFSKKIGNSYALPIPKIEFQLEETPEKRTSPIRFNYPISELDSIAYKIPTLEKVKIPKDYKISSEFGDYEVSFEKQENSVVARRIFFIKRGDYPLEKYPALYSFIDQINKKENSIYLILDQ